MTKRIFLITIPFWISLVWALVTPFGGMLPLLIGLGLSILLALWIRFFRHPQEYRLALKHFNNGEPHKALQLINIAIKKRPGHGEAYLLRANIHLHLFEFLEAERNAHSAVNLIPQNYRAYQSLGTALLDQQRYNEADKAYSKALDLASQYATNYFYKGMVCYRLGEFEKARQLFEMALQKQNSPANIKLLASYYLANCLSAAGEEQPAQSLRLKLKRYRKSYDGLVTLYREAPDHADVLLMRSELRDMRRYMA
ncbi:MAG: tetratricopeptide repeat protein [Anaerolineae bacterium]|nr:tetratricopeptide repeat protein [Anaerolineae bacterium]